MFKRLCSATGVVTCVAMVALSGGALAQDGAKVCKVTALRYSGYANRLHESVKQSISLGDTLYEGDVLDVRQGNYVQLAFDDEGKNIVHLQGNSLIQFSKEGGISLELTNGKVYSLLDNLARGTKFRVCTPAAIATVRGTNFKVETTGSATSAAAYEGLVRITGRGPDGRAMGREVILKPAFRTEVAGAGKEPVDPMKMSKTDFAEINTVIRSLGGAKQELDYDLMAGEISSPNGSASADSPAASGEKKETGGKPAARSAKSAKSESSGSENGKVVY